MFDGPLEDRMAIRERIEAYSDAVFRKDADAWIANWRETFGDKPNGGATTTSNPLHTAVRSKRRHHWPRNSRGRSCLHDSSSAVVTRWRLTPSRKWSGKEVARLSRKLSIDMAMQRHVVEFSRVAEAVTHSAQIFVPQQDESVEIRGEPARVALHSKIT